MGEAMQSGESKESLALSGGVRTSSLSGDAVDRDVRDVGWSNSVPVIGSLPGLTTDWDREAPVGMPRWS